jgi:alanyl-tRNA synthetase
MNYEEIMARIAAGESEEAIVKEFTDNINKANAELRARAEEEAKAKAAEAEANAKREELERHKNNLATDIADALNEYAEACGIDNPEIDMLDVRELLDAMMDLVPAIKNLQVFVKTPTTTAKKKVGVTGKGKSTIADDVFAEFFKSLGI